MPDAPNPTRLLRVSDLPQNSPTEFDIRPDKGEMARIATELQLLGVRKMRFTGALTALGKSDWQLKANLGVTVIQPCVVTLESVTTRVEAPLERQFLKGMVEPDEEGEETEMTEDENTEALGNTLDLGLIMLETLALNLPLYPRSDGADHTQSVFTEPGKKAMTDEDVRPFAGLASLRDQLGTKDEK